MIPVNVPKLAWCASNWKNAKPMLTSPNDSDLLCLSALATRLLPFPYFETTILGVEETKIRAIFGPAVEA